MNFLELRHLRMVRAIAETGIMTRAAENLFITQSALSQQLKDIENKLKVDLFYRTPKQMILTPSGKKLLATAEQVIGCLEDAELDIARTVQGETGELKVGTQCIFCYKWLPGVLEKFQTRFPNVEFELGTAGPVDLELESKRFDIVITGTQGRMEFHDHTPLFNDQMVCIMPPDHPLCARSFVRPQDFQGTCMISHAEKEKNNFYQLFLKPQGIRLKRFMAVSQPQAMMEMVAAGFGLAVLPAWAAGSFLDTGRICARPITRAGIMVTWYAAFLKNGNPPPVFQTEFIRILSRLNPGQQIS